VVDNELGRGGGGGGKALDKTCSQSTIFP